MQTWFTPSHRMKCAKANLVDAAFIESLQTAIKPANCHSWVMEQSGLIVEQVSSHRNAPPRQFLHVFTKTFAVTLAICGWNPPRSCHLEPRALPHRTGKYKAFPNARFSACKTLMRMTSTQIQLQKQGPCRSTMSGLRYLSTPWVDSSLRPRSGALAPVFGTKCHLCCVCLRNCVSLQSELVYKVQISIRNLK